MSRLTSSLLAATATAAASATVAVAAGQAATDPPLCPGKAGEASSIFVVVTKGDGASGFGLRAKGISCAKAKVIAVKYVRCRAVKGRGASKPAGFNVSRSKGETHLRKGSVTVRFFVTAGDEPLQGSAKPPNCR